MPRDDANHFRDCTADDSLALTPIGQGHDD